ncbi:MAG: glycoside hydrolase family 95 protein [Victivallaceae bacterium]|nr:glycoside hydrolase family 95 protein [Victivallaceae bacterium]
MIILKLKDKLTVTMNNQLFYDKPATDCLEGMPIVTGRLAAMILNINMQ